MTKSKARIRGHIVQPGPEQALPEPADPQAWMVNRLQEDEDGQPLMEGIFSNYNDDIVIETDSMTLVGRTDQERGPAQRIAVEAPLWIRDGTLGTDVPAAPVAATAAEYLANSAPTKMLTSGAVWAAAPIVTLTDGATVTMNESLGIDFVLTLAGTGRTMANPTNIKAGQKGILVIQQDGTGSRTITTWGSNWKFPGGIKPTLSTAINAIDIISYVQTSTNIYCTFTADFK